MKCTITLLVGGESILILVDSSNLPSSISELRNLLGKEKWENLVDKINTTLKNRKKINPADLEKIKKSNHIIPNTTIGALINRFSDIAFPEDSDLYNISDKKVLFVDSYRTTKGELKYGLFINPNGEEVFIVDRYNLNSIAKYLQTMKSLKSDHILRNVSPEIMNELKEVLLEVKKYISNLSSVEDMIISFLLNRNKYSNLVFLNKDSDNVSIYAYLDEFVGNLFKISHRRSYNNVTINNISHSILWNKNFDTASISIDLLFGFLSTELKNNIANIIGEELTLEKFKEYFSGKINLLQLNNIFKVSEGSPYEILLNYLIQLEPEFAMLFKEIKNNRIYMNTYFLTLESLYGIGFNLLLELNDPIYYNGRYIQQIVKDGISTYYVTKHYTTPEQRALKFNTLLEARNYIDNNLLEPIVPNSFIEFHKKELGENGKLITDDSNSTKIRTKRKYSKGTLITVLDYDVPNISISMLTPNESMFVSENYRNYDDTHPLATKEDFYNFVKEDLGFDDLSDTYRLIINNINTPEKIALFIMGLNNPNTGKGKAFDKNSETAIKKLATTIGKINNYRYYLVKSSNGHTTEVVPINNDIKENSQTPPKRPVIQLWKAASFALVPKLGINMEILMEPEPGKENKKAYIKNNTVYINLQNSDSSDLFHEYVHILMAYLKNNPNYRNKYSELINTIWNLGESDLRRKEIENSYKDYSIEDKMEEYFVDLFGKWIKNNANSNFSNIFTQNDILKEGSSIFSSTTPITELYGSTIEQVFTKLNSDVAQFFKDNKPLMSAEYKNLFTASRQKSEWIRLQIHDKKLIEYDCV